MTEQQPARASRYSSSQMGPQSSFQSQAATPTTAPASVGVQMGESQQKLQNFWSNQVEQIRNMKVSETTPPNYLSRTHKQDGFKFQELPLARIKKIMKQDEEVKMISAEAPILFSKAAEIFVAELSLRAWIHTEDSKRRTLQKNDVAMAVSKYDQFDFLIDIVPREDTRVSKRPGTMIDPGQMQYYLQVQQNFLLQQQQAQQQAQAQAQAQQSQVAPTQQEQQQQQHSNQSVAAPQTPQIQQLQIQVPGGQSIQQLAQFSNPGVPTQTLMLQAAATSATPTQATAQLQMDSDLQHLQTVVVPTGVQQVQTLHHPHPQQQPQDAHVSQLPVDLPQAIHYVLPHSDASSVQATTYLSQLPLHSSTTATPSTIATVGMEMAQAQTAGNGHQQQGANTSGGGGAGGGGDSLKLVQDLP